MESRSSKACLREYRGLYRRLLAAQAPARRPVARLAQPLLRPLRAVRNARLVVARWADPVAAERGISRRRQLWTMSWLAVVHRMPPELYYRYRLFEPRRRQQAKWFLHWDEHNRMLAHLVQCQAPLVAQQLEDKQAFARWCLEQDLPHPRIWASVEQGRLSGELPPEALFSKPIHGFGGRGGTAWHRDELGRYVGDDLVLDQTGLIHELQRRSLESSLMVQARLRSHESLRALDGDGLATLRLVTGRPPTGTPVVLSATFGMPMAGSSVDNFHAGGLCAAVQHDGRLGLAARVVPEECLVGHRRHPDSHAPIEGVVLPWWEDARAIALHAHSRVDTIAFVGWDVALTDDGPILLEANTVWDAAMPQVPEGIPLGRTDYLCWFLAHFERARPAANASDKSRVAAGGNATRIVQGSAGLSKGRPIAGGT